MKAIYTLLFVLITTFAIGQETFNIKGTVEDTINNPLISSTVLLLHKADSTLVKFTRTELDGSFVFKKIPAGQYLLKTTYVGYIPKTLDASSNGDNIDFGTIAMTELAAELMEVVIKAAKAPIKMKGDTIEYDASTFQVPEGSSVEELLKQLPGIEVEQDGSIMADGKDVDRVTVDGKKFFGNDPKAATKNLPAEGISKVQVFDTKTESAKVTGQVGQAESKTMNLELKEEFKKGGFGRVTGGVGTESRAELKGNYNRFNDKIQFSLVGVGNNTGRNGLGWNDYQDFMGSQSFNFGEDDSYGFGGSGNFTYYFGGDNGGNALENSVQNIFFSNSDNGGFPENYNGGINFNYDHKKTQLSSVYYYNQNGLIKDNNRNTRNFFQDFTATNRNVNSQDNISRGHRAEISIDQEIDSLHSFKIDLNGAYIDENKLNKSNINLSRDAALISESDFDNTKNTTGNLFNGIVYFRKKFQKKGRRFGANFSYLLTNLDDDGLQKSTTTFYDDNAMPDSISAINQETLNNASKTQMKANAVYVEPLSKVLFSQTFYNFSTIHETGTREVEDVSGDIRTINTLLSREFDNTIGLHRVGSAVRYSNKGVNVSIGGGYQVMNLLGSFNQLGVNEPTKEVNESYGNFIPHFSVDYNISRNASIDFGYGLSASAPSINNLQAIVDNSNPLYIFEGNPDLKPEVTHGVNLSFRRNFPLSRVRFYGRLNYDVNTNSIVNNESVDENLITYVQPVNYEGGDRISFYGSVNFPIYKSKLKGSVRFRANAANSFAFVNDFLNKTNSVGYYPSLNLTFTPTKETAVYFRGNWNVVDTKYDINSSQDQRNIRSVYSISANSLMFLKIYGDVSYNYTNVTNDRFNVNQSVPILNASIYRQFLPGNKLEVRVSIYDALDQNRNISQFASGNSVTESETFSLGRYLMLSMTYNIKGLKSGVNKRNGWW